MSIKNNKKCIRCLKIFDISFFHKCISFKDGYKNVCKDCIKIAKKIYYQKYKEKISNDVKKYREGIPEIIKQRKSQYYQKNKKQINEEKNNKLKSCPITKKKHNIRVNNLKNLKRAMKFYEEGRIDELPKKSPSKQIFKLFEIQNNSCIYCDLNIQNDYHIEHLIPISKGGSNNIHNLALSCSSCNLRKNCIDLNIWLNIIGSNYNNFMKNIEKRNLKYFS